MIIGINGFKGAGKNTVGSYLVNHYDFTEVSFAEKLKESAAAIWGIDSNKWEKWKNNNAMRVIIASEDYLDEYEANVSVREFLQRYGTEAHRTIFGADFWVDHALKDIDTNEKIVFTDARFENELERIKSLGGYNLQVLRPGVFTKDAHASEVAPAQHLIDYAVDNNGSFEDLYAQVDDFMSFVYEDRTAQTYV